MPIYEYSCEKCGKKFERWSRKIRESDWVEICPHDGGTGHRVISPAAFVLKGPGWAKDGYSKDGKKTGKQKRQDSPGPSNK